MFGIIVELLAIGILVLHPRRVLLPLVVSMHVLTRILIKQDEVTAVGAVDWVL